MVCMWCFLPPRSAYPPVPPYLCLNTNAMQWDVMEGNGMQCNYVLAYTRLSPFLFCLKLFCLALLGFRVDVTCALGQRNAMQWDVMECNAMQWVVMECNGTTCSLRRYYHLLFRFVSFCFAGLPGCRVDVTCALGQMRDAYVALSAAKERMGRQAILDKYKGLMAEKFVRTEPLGSDRDGRRYWVFEGDSR